MYDARQQHIFGLVNSFEDFLVLCKSGVFWEWFPDLDGTYEDFLKHQDIWRKEKEVE